jgi:hypothetical protein
MKPQKQWQLSRRHFLLGSAIAGSGIIAANLRSSKSGLAQSDISNNFSAISNPTDSWSYGWKNAEGDTQLHLMNEFGQYEATNYWRDSALGNDGGYWSIAHNPRTSTYNDGYTEWMPNAVVIHARPGAIVTVRWQPPSAGIYNISTVFTSAHYWQWGNNKQVSIALNGSILFSDTIGNYGTNATSSLTDLSLHANDTVDFMLKGVQTPFGVYYYVTSTRLEVQAIASKCYRRGFW